MRLRIGLLLGVLSAAAIFAITQTRLWQTGRSTVAPLDLIAGGPVVAPVGRIWIDTDAACGAAPRTDPDDCLAIVWLVARGADVVGISTSFGNASGEVVANTVAGLARAMAQDGMAVPPVFVGHQSPLLETSSVSPGAAALRDALHDGPLTVLALGPLSTIESALNGQPGLQANVTRLVAVMGHRPGHLFHPSEGRGSGALLGHGPIFRDLNVAVDPDAVRAVLAMDLPVTLIPYDAATDIMITATDLDLLAAQSPVMSLVSLTARDWLAYWTADIGLRGFYPFDWVAAAYLGHPALFNCAETGAVMAREWAFWALPRVGLQVGAAPDDAGEAGEMVLYCPQTADALHDLLAPPL